MTIKECILVHGELPKKARLANGQVIELEIEQRHTGGFWIGLWELTDGLKDHIICHDSGRTEAEAKENLKKQILNSLD